MGRKNQKKKMWNRKRKLEESEDKSKKDRKPYVKCISSNPKMEAYYAAIGLHATQKSGPDSKDFKPCLSAEDMEAERVKFITCMRTSLRASFRIAQNIEQEFREHLIEDVENFVGTEIEIEVDEDGNAVSKARGDTSMDVSETDTEGNVTDIDTGKTTLKKLAPAKAIPYIPDAYQLSVDRRTIRRNPALQNFHEWLKAQTDAGFVTRQETVSMIPPVVLSPEPHHAVLDMCAAPGSKTSQLLEYVSSIPEGGTEPEGFVVANDSDAKRAYMLVHQLRRINSPASFVTAKDAQFFPQLLRGENTTNEERAQEGLFDRVLCDVPCSGDGTGRKNPGIWKHWSQSAAHSIHPVQVGIGLNGARLAKVGGFICYSTCSMNPIENEAVVAQILRDADGSLELVDKRKDMPNIVARPGWTKWKVFGESESKRIKKDKQKKNNEKMKKRRKEYEEKQGNGKSLDVEESRVVDDTQEEETKEDTWSETPESWDENYLTTRAALQGLLEYKTFEDVPINHRHHIRQSCFPPSAEEVDKFNLERCLRCLPHDLYTGGFFVALFKKVSPLSARAKRKADELAKANSDKYDFRHSKHDKNESKSDQNKVIVPEKSSEDVPSTELAKKKKGGYGFNNAESFVTADTSLLHDLSDFYGFTEEFTNSQFYSRAGGKSKILYYITESVKKNLIDRGIQDKIQVINSGLRGFERRNKDDCVVNYRPCQESIHYIAPHMSKRKFAIGPKDFYNCLKRGSNAAIPCESFSEPICKKLRETSLGAFVFVLEGYEFDISKKMYMVMWRCRGDAVNCLVCEAEMNGFKSKLKAFTGIGEGIIPFTNNIEMHIEKEKNESYEEPAQTTFSNIRDKCIIQ
jgi:16S rRNA C967 or C1407 C5-methylase (RsmB/RsmF family)